MRPVFHKLALTFALCCAAGGALAQEGSRNWDPRSGDAWVDTWLADVNQYGARYREPFVDELHRYYGAPRDLVTDLLTNRRWAPGDVYYACAIASVIGRSCRYVVDEWERDNAEGWGAVAKRLGVKPGSPEFHRLKRGFVPSYDRWGRPIALDSDLAREFPNRGNAGHALPPGQAKKAANPASSDMADKGNRGNAKGVGNSNGKSKGAGNSKAKGNGKDARKP